MKKIQFKTQINAPREKVWHALIDDEPYREWTQVFSEGSYYRGDWEEGSKILFLGPDPQTGEESGMVSRIAENRPHEFISIQHLGIYKNGVEDTTSDEAKKWAPAFENYTLNEMDGGTELVIDMDIEESEAEAFTRMWPEALERLKAISERE